MARFYRTIATGQSRVSRETMALFADAEIAENDVQNVLDIDPAGQAAQRLGGKPEFLGDDILAAVLAFGQGAREGVAREFQRFSLALAAHQGRLGSKEFGGMAGEMTEKGLETLPGHS